jgi:hypothetical protein
MRAVLYRMDGKSYLASLRAQAAVPDYRAVEGVRFPRDEKPYKFFLPSHPVSKRTSKSAGSKTRTLKVRNWQITARHFN